MPIPSGVYVITNVQQGNPVFLESPDDEVPLRGHCEPENASEQWHWNVIARKNGRHSIQNINYKRYANCGPRAGLKTHVRGDGDDQKWLIQETRDTGKYTIAATDTRNVWMLPDAEEGTPVELFNIPTDRRCWWTFTNLEPGAPVKEDLTNGAYLFSLKSLPILPFSPLNLDFVIIQQMPEYSIENASRTVGGICDRLVSLRRVRRDALCVNIIEVMSVGSDIFFERSCDVVTFERLLNPGGPHIRWEECDGASLLPTMAMRGLRANTTKIAILNLDVTLFQQSGQATMNLIDRLAKHDITLILTPIPATWEHAFSDSFVFTELKKRSSEYRRFRQESQFSDYVVNYNKAVALPRLAEDRKLRDEIRPNIPRIVEVIRGQNDDIRSAAITALSQLAEHVDLRDVIFQTVYKIVEMLKSNGAEAEAAASALIKLVKHVELRAQIFQALHKIIQTLKGSSDGETLSQHAGEGPDIKDSSGRTSLAWAAAIGHEAIVRIFLAHQDIDVNAKDRDGWTPLSLAAANGHHEVVRLLLAQDGVDINFKHISGTTPLYSATINGHDAVVKLLLAQKGVNVNSEATCGSTPLYAAAHKGHDAIVRLLLTQKGVDINSKHTTGMTPLYAAARNGHHVVVWLLLAQKGVEVNSKESTGATPLYIAAAYGHSVAVQLLLAHADVDVNSKDMTGATPLYIAAAYGHDAVVQLLLGQRGVDVNSKDMTGATPLYIAAEKRHDAVVRLLIAQEGVDINSRHMAGTTPLGIAAHHGHDTVVRLLLAQEGVDVNAMDDESQTPLKRARKGEHEAVVLLLREKIEQMRIARKGEKSKDSRRARWFLLPRASTPGNKSR